MNKKLKECFKMEWTSRKSSINEILDFCKHLYADVEYIHDAPQGTIVKNDYNIKISFNGKEIEIDFNADFLEGLENLLHNEVDYMEKNEHVTPAQNSSSELTIEDKIAFVEKYKGSSISTGYGPSIVVELTDDGEHVLLLEFGTESYLLTFDDFVSQINEYN